MFHLIAGRYITWNVNKCTKISLPQYATDKGHYRTKLVKERDETLTQKILKLY